MDERVDASAPFLLPGFEVADVPRLRALMDGRKLLDVFIGIFRGSEEEVVVRLLVLSTLASRAEAPRWSPADLSAALAYLDPVSLETARRRLSEYGLLVYDSAEGTYAVGEHAFIVLAAWASAMQFADGRFGEFGFMNAQIAGSEATLGVSDDLLRFALARTNTLHQEIERAIVTGSATAIEEARGKVKDVFQWGTQAVDILERIAPDPTITSDRRAAARRLADAQSRMLGLAPRLDRTLHALDAQRIRLGDSGLDTADVKAWLRLRTVDELVNLTELVGVPIRSPGFVLGDIATDVAEDLILEERPDVVPLPAPVEPQEAAPPEVDFDPARLERLFAFLDEVREPVPLASLATDKAFDEASYHFSLLTLLGGGGEINTGDPAAPLAKYPLDLDIDTELTAVASGEVAAVSEGRVRPRGF